ncbi:hypothetical protein K2173_000765 [Erythroxylum novogranatense]|uniref:Negative regulator of systemic acquired resistance SNI1 n=1 Tax=Erythroxylum novogranatense TaxID=1862640 RepID=A0AAV8T3Y4_9ROSI|nr:hypothetical protein K2173_000765 [Erythroxylum novogranatense]
MSRVREENVLAILDASTTASNPTQHQTDDQIAFLRAVRGAFLVRDYQTHPTNKIYEPVFGIMRMGSSLELILESFRLLCDLHQRFPRVHVLDKDGSESPELVVDEDAWSPFVFSSDVAWSVRQSAGKTSSSPLDSSAFQTLIEELSEVFNDANLQALETKTLGNILLFQYLVRILEEDFVARKRVYDETMNWTLVRDSLLSMLLSSRRINYRSLMKDCFFIICGLCQDCTQSSAGLISSDSSTAKPTTTENTTVAIASLEAVNNIGASLQKLLIIIMELDTLRKKADLEGGITRADGVRTPLLEIILDELTYNRDLLSPFFQKFHHPKWKLEIILQYFSKYNAKPSVRTRRSNSSTEDATFNGVLRCFSNITSTKKIIKKISKDVVQLLLAHGFQVILFHFPFSNK